MRILALLLCAIGAFMTAQTFTAPRYAAQWSAAQSSIARTPLDSLPNHQSRTQRFYDLQAHYRTAESYEQDYGRGLLTLGLSVFVLSLGFGERVTFAPNLGRPDSKITVIVIVALSWFINFAAQEIWIAYCAARGDFPAWADSIAIPLVQFNALALLSAPVVIVALFAALAGAPLTQKRAPLAFKNVRFWLSTIMGLALVAFFANECAVAVHDGAVPIVAACTLCLAGVYSWWSAATAPRIARHQRELPTASCSP